MASRILGMGDVLSLIEKAEQSLDAKKAAEQMERLRKNKFTLADFYDQLVQLKSMGSMEDIMGMLPGMGGKKLDLTVDEGNLKRIEVVDVNRLLKQFDMIQQFTRQFASPKKAKGLFGKFKGMGMPF